jgi:hypothetical protein
VDIPVAVLGDAPLEVPRWSLAKTPQHSGPAIGSKVPVGVLQLDVKIVRSAYDEEGASRSE